MTAYLETARLRLRATPPDDAHALAVERSCDFVMRYNLYRPSTAEEIAEELEVFEHIIVEKSDTGISIGYEDYGVSQFGGDNFEKTYYLDKDNSKKLENALKK